MFKILRFPNVVFKLLEKKQYNDRIFNFLGLNAPYSSNLRTQRCYSITQKAESENNGYVTQQSEGQIIKEVIADNPELEQKIKMLILELEVMRQDGNKVPSNSFLRKDYWQELLRLNSRTARKKYLTFLFKLEKKKENMQLKKEKKQEERNKESKLIENTDGHLTYSLMQNTILLRVYDSTINNFYNSRLIQAMMFGQKLIVDCGYDKEMTKRENVNCAKQLMLLFGENRINDDPYDLHLCNLNKGSSLAEALHRQIVTMYEPWFPLNIHEKSYLEVFPKDKLIYLTPNCREEMLEYDHDAVYIIGGIVDKAKNDPLSLAKAKKEGLKMLKLPVDRYLQWRAGSGKNLTLNQMILILLDIKATGDWNYALRHVPKRKVLDEDNVAYNSTLRYDRDDDRQLRNERKSNVKFKNSIGKRLETNTDSSKHKINFNIKSVMYK
ncbi:hypothetical protein Trydic_g13057 [Trypoxylus dichotomus]